MHLQKSFRGTVCNDGTGTLDKRVNDWLKEKEKSMVVVSIAVSVPNSQKDDVVQIFVYCDVATGPYDGAVGD